MFMHIRRHGRILSGLLTPDATKDSFSRTPDFSRSFHAAGGKGGSGGEGDAPDKIGKNSGGIKLAHTS